MKVLIVGQAGSGKTTLTNYFGKWLTKNGYKVRLFNLDPGIKDLPYLPHFDIRNFFTVEKIMKEEGIGPNAALIRAMERLLENKEKIIERFDESADFHLIDTPGQLEIFAFHEVGKEIASLCDVGFFLIPTTSISSAPEFCIFYLLYLVTEIRLGLELLPVITKAKKRVDIDFENLRVEGFLTEISEKVCKIVKSILPSRRPIFIDSLREKGFDELLDILHEFKCTCGDLT